MSKPRIAAVVPAYRVRSHLARVVTTMPEGVSHVIVVDDACPEKSYEVIADLFGERVTLVQHSENRGVGGAMKTGFAKAAELGYDIVVKIDGDGQMDPRHIARLVEPLAKHEAAYCKGNRFWFLRELEQMPVVRRIGNLGLSFLVKAASGQWSIFDPTNGFVAIRTDVFNSLSMRAIADDYFFEISLLIELGRRGFRVLDIPMPSVYGDEKSSLSIRRVLINFPPRLLRRGLSRFAYRHFWFSFSVSAVFILVGVPLFAWGIGFGLYGWWRSAVTGQVATAGQVMLSALPFLTGFHLLLSALNHEVASNFNNRIAPDEPIHVD